MKPITVDKTPEQPRWGERIPVERFHISKLNVRFDEPFGESERDKNLIENLRRGNIVEPFLARPEEKGFGVYVGRRRFLGKCAVGTKAFVVGKDVLIENIDGELAREESLVDNLDVLREEMNPLARARGVQNLIDHNMIGLRAVARKLGLAPSTLSEWLKILELHEPMQKAVEKGLLYYKDALGLAKMNVGEIKEEELAQVLEKQGRDVFMDEIEKIKTGHGKRGIPKGKYIIVRTVFEKAHDESKYNNILQQAQVRNMEIDEYVKLVLTDKKALMEYAKSLD
jgi:ParB/RepB/Spo0J family partition protein